MAGALLAALAFALAACGGGGDDDASDKTKTNAAPVRIGTKNFTESKILGELYKQALEAEGVPVNLQSDVGSTEVTHAALRGGFLDMYPEYVGVLLSEVDKVSKRPANAAQAYELAKQYEEEKPFTLLEATEASNENALAVTEAFARRNDIDSIDDLKRIAKTSLLGAPTEFRNRFEGLIGLRKLYSLRLKMKPLDLGDQYGELDRGKVDIAVVFTTDPQLLGGRYKVLADPEGVFAEQHIVPVVSQKVLKAHAPTLAAVINAVSALLTTPVMRSLNAKVDLDGRTPREVADEFLLANDLKRAGR